MIKTEKFATSKASAERPGSSDRGRGLPKLSTIGDYCVQKFRRQYRSDQTLLIVTRLTQKLV